MTRRFTSALLCGLAAIAGASAATAAGVPRPLSGTLQFYIGSGLPIPIRPKGTPMDAACLPQGGINGIKAVNNAMITTYANGAFKMPPSQFTLRGPGNPYGPKVQGVMTQNPVALQVYTNFKIQVPGPTPANPLQPHSGGVNVAPFGGANGRTGLNTISWCPGYTASLVTGTMGTPAKNPGCNNPGSHAPVYIHTCGTVSGTMAPGCPGPNKANIVIPGFMKYTRTGKMLGGPGTGTLSGPFDVAIGAPGGGAFFIAGQAPMSGQQGMSFGNYHQANQGKGPQKAPVLFNSCGIITFIGTIGAEKAASNRTTATFGGPITQGKLTVKADTGIGYESYMIAGYDHRGPAYGPNTMGTKAVKGGLPPYKAGQGRLSLVSGSLGLRSLTGENANRGFLFFEIPEPGAIAGAVVSLGVLIACHQILRRRAK